MSLLPVLHEEDEEGDDSRPRRESLTANHKRRQSAYYQRQSIKPIDNESIAAKQKKISLNRDYTGKYQSNEKRVSLTERERLSKACHRPVIVPMVKIIGKVPGYVDVSELETLRREVCYHLSTFSLTYEFVLVCSVTQGVPQRCEV